MSQNNSQYKAVAAILTSAITSINSILTSAEDEMHKIRISNRLQQEADQLLLLTGSGDLATGKGAVLGPATTIGGKPISKQRRFTADDMIPADDKVNKLKKDVEAAVGYFGPNANAEGILANIPELIIRGVAKKVGLPYKKDEVETITVEFIEKIKEALAAAGIKGEPNDDDDEEEDDELNAAGNQPLIAGQGGVSEVRIISTNDVGGPMGEGKVESEKQEAPVNELQSAPVVEEPKAEEPKQEPKPEPKKKTGK
jgi:hypothetical protein